MQASIALATYARSSEEISILNMLWPCVVASLDGAQRVRHYGYYKGYTNLATQVLYWFSPDSIWLYRGLIIALGIPVYLGQDFGVAKNTRRIPYESLNRN